MKIIHQLEKEPRGIYCGLIGIIKPFGETIFNVAIRGLQAISDNNFNITKVNYGVGSGITVDAFSEQEIKELYSKFSFLI